MSLTDLVTELERMPSQEEPVFPFAVRGLRSKFGVEVADSCEGLLALSEDEVRKLGSSDPGETRFLALYILLLINWRELNFRRYRELVDRYDDEFPGDSYPYFLTFRSQYYASRGEDHDDLSLALDYARMAMERLPRGPAVLHLYAVTTIKIGELGGNVSAEQFATAESALATAIGIDRELVAQHEKPRRFAMYHATMARLQTLRGRHLEARRELHKAFDLEDPADTGRVSEFFEIRGQILLNQRIEPVRSEVEALSERIEKEAESLKDLSTGVADQIRGQAVQLLGLLAAVLAFLFTGTEIARNLDFDQAAKLMLVVSGAILVVFAGFSLTFYGERLTLRRAGAALPGACIGAALMATGMLV